MMDLTSMGMNDGVKACQIVIEALESELRKARTISHQYESGSMPSSTVLPLRHFCAGLVETAIELARHIGELPTSLHDPQADLAGRAERD